MTAAYFFTQLINGLRLGSVYAIVAVGYSIVYGILKLINFAHGDIMTIGVYAIIVLMTSTGLPLWLVILISVCISVLAGLLIERLAYRPLRRRNAQEEAVLVASLAVSTLLQNLLQMVFSSQKKPFRLPDVLTARIDIGAIQLSVMNIITFVAVAILLVILLFIVKKTRIGTAMRACSENMTAARLMGISVTRVVVFAFALGSALAAVAGLMLAGEYKTASPDMGFVPGLKAFCAAVVGGIGSLGGAVVGGILIGLAEMLFAGLVPTSLTAYRDAFVFVVLIVVLLVRPNGLFNVKEGGRS